MDIVTQNEFDLAIINHGHWVAQRFMGAKQMVFRYMDMSNISWESVAHLEGADFTGSTFFGAENGFALECVDFVNCTFVDCSFGDIVTSTFVQCHMSGSTFYNSVFSCRFRYCGLSSMMCDTGKGQDIIDTTFEKCNLADAKFKMTSFNRCLFEFIDSYDNASFDDCHLENVKFKDGRRKLAKAIFVDTTIDDATNKEKTFTREQLKNIELV